MKYQRGIATGWLYLIGLVALVAALSAAVYGIHHDGYKQGIAEKQTEWDAANEKQRAAEAKQAAEASTQVEVKSEKAKIVYKTITQSVDKYIDRPIYRNVCLDDFGLRDANAALVGQVPTAGEPDKPVPAVKPTQ